jgi:hypothetical protein
VDQLWDAAGTLTLPVMDRYDTPEVRRLVGLCYLLQKRAGGQSFFLACRTVGRLAGCHYTTAWRWLWLLERQDVLLRTGTGTQASKKANEYRYVASGGASLRIAGPVPPARFICNPDDPSRPALSAG